VVAEPSTKTAIGLEENVAGAIAYALGWITGGYFFLTESGNRFVRFHALQSIVTFGSLCVIWILIIAVIPVVGIFLAFVIVVPLSLVLWLLLMYKAYQGERFKLPWAGDIAERWQ
jgi:uncharacterized membrane protein